MNLEWTQAPIAQAGADAVLLFAFAGNETPHAGFRRCDEQLGALLTTKAAWRDFKPEAGHTAVFYPPEESEAPRVICAGLGPAADFDADALRRAVSAGLGRCRSLETRQVALPLAIFDGIDLANTDVLQETLLAALLGLYRYAGMKSRDADKPAAPETLLLLADEAHGAEPPPVLDRVRAIAAGVALARDATAAPANVMTPSDLAAIATDLAGRHGFDIEVLDLEAARRRGMGAFAAVAQGSAQPPRFIVLDYRPDPGREERPIVLVGKGITFDSGGLSLKPAASMEHMKRDMAGAAAVLGVLEAVGRMRPPRRVVGILPCAENMPDGSASRPGDVVRTLAGLTVEIINTDAEGRLVLSDGLAHGAALDPVLMIDVATLTGAALVALGDRVGAVMGNHEGLVESIRRLSMETGDRFWPLPLWDFYFEDLKSDVADFKNVGSRKAGAIIGGIFLKQFVPDTVPWAHLDIAGAAWSEKDQPTAPKGATGFGVRLLIELVDRFEDLNLPPTP